MGRKRDKNCEEIISEFGTEEECLNEDANLLLFWRIIPVKIMRNICIGIIFLFSIGFLLLGLFENCKLPFAVVVPIPTFPENDHDLMLINIIDRIQKNIGIE
jgi:hypothetical protein